MDERYSKLATPPVSALKAINGGTLSGKANINPQWKIQAVTEVYGLCGIGWKYEIADKQIIDCPDGQKLIYLTVALQVKDGDQWSAPIYGIGGDLIIKKRGSGLLADDDAYKKCLTDALGNAMKNIGVAADVYREMFDTKYGEFVRTEPKDETPQTSNKKEANKKEANKKEPVNRKLAELITVVAENGINPDYFCELLYNVNKEELSIDQINYVLEDLNRAFTEFQKRDAGRQEEIPM